MADIYMIKTGKTSMIRDYNQTLILENIIKEKVISRASLSKKLGLTKATISAIVDVLINNNLVIETGNEDTSKGRKPINLMLNREAGYVIAINLDVDNVTAAISDLTGENIQTDRFAMDINPAYIIKNLINVIEGMAGYVDGGLIRIKGIAIGIHGVVLDNEVKFTPYYDLGDVDIKKELEEYFNIPVYLENEANLAAIAELTFSKRFDNMALLSIHTGVGIGLIANGELYSGYSGHAGEFGHTTIEVDGRECPCGNRGCLEQYISERSILREYRKASKISDASFSDYIEAYKKGDSVAIVIMDEFIKYMTVAIRNIINMFNPEIILVNSIITNECPEITTKITDNLNSNLKSICNLAPSSISKDNILKGGIAKAVCSFLNINNLDLQRY